MMLRKAIRRFAPATLRGVHRSTAARAEAFVDHQSQPTEKKKLGFSVIFLFLPCVATFGLGTWQIFRREWKADLLEYKRKRLGEEPILLTDALKNAEDSKKSTPELEYRRVMCEGTYNEGKSIFLGPRMKNLYGSSQRGYYIITPLYPISSSSDVQPPVLVNRGWVPTAWREDFEKGIFTPTVMDERFQKDKIRTGAWWKTWWKAKPSVEIASESEANGAIKVCGVVRTGENPNMFVPLNEPEHGQWFYIDIPGMLKATGLPENTPYIEAVSESPLDEDKITFPVPKEIEDFVKTSLMPNDHLTYAFTWYTLSAATTYMAVKRVQDKPGFLKIQEGKNTEDMMKFSKTALDLSINRVVFILGFLGLALIITMLYENSISSIQWSEIYTWKKNTDDLQTGGLVDQACLSRSLQHGYRGSEAPSYSGALLQTWDRYIAMHKSCVKDTVVNWTRILESSSSGGSCKYLVYVETGEGLGNRILSLASALVYALLTDRVLLIDSRKELCKLMCEPFKGSSWLLPSDFPYGIVDKAPDLGKAIEQKFNQTPVIHLRLAHIESHTDQLFFCDEYQQKFNQVPVLAWSSNQYFVTNFFRVPSLWRKLIVLFPTRLNIFAQLTSLALSPANEVWTLISRYYTSYLSCSNSLVGVQIRPHGRANLAEFDPSVYQIVLNCLTTHGLIPRFSNVDQERFSLRQTKHRVKVSVFVASLQGKYYQTFRNEFLRNLTNELANFYVLSSEGGESHSHHQASLALAEMWLLSFSNHIVTSEYSTFGYIANAAANKRPWLLKIRGTPLNVSDNICYLGQSTEPCTHFPQGFKCGNYSQEHADWIKAHIAECQDQRWGLQLLN